MDREWAGGIGRIGRSNAGKRLAHFFIGRFLIASNCPTRAVNEQPGEFSRPPSEVKHDV
jgi:hypothetical protein